MATLFLKPRDWMAFYSAYFDESDSDATSVVAGVVMSVDQMPDFEREWHQLMSEAGVRYLHMKEFAHSRGQFEGWKGNEARRAGFLRRVVGIISRRANISVGIIVDRSGWARFAEEYPEMTSLYRNEYMAASLMSVIRTAGWADEHKHDQAIAYVFDDGNPKRTDFERAFNFVKSVPNLRSLYHLGSLTFADDKSVEALQLADFVAYEACKVYTDIKHDKRRLRRSMDELRSKVVGDWRICSYDGLVELARLVRSKGEML